MGDETRYNNPDNVKPNLEEVFTYFGGDLPDYRKSHGLKVVCPFHNESNASAVFNEERQTFHCFGCEARGDSWQLIMDFHGTDYPGALRFAVEMDWLQVAEDGVTLEGGVESMQEQSKPRRRGRRVRKLRRRRR